MGNCIEWGIKKSISEYPNFTLNVLSKTSGQTELGVYDFHYNNDPKYQNNIHYCETTIKRNCFLHEFQNKVSDKSFDCIQKSDQNRSLAFAFAKGDYYIFNGNEISQSLQWNDLKNRLWLVINKVSNNKQSIILHNQKYKLKNGDLVKFGCAIFKVIIANANSFENKSTIVKKNAKIKPKNKALSFNLLNYSIGTEKSKCKPDRCISSTNFQFCTGAIISENIMNEDNEDSLYHDIEFTRKNIDENVCRICYGKDEEQDNPLIDPCKCSGSLKYIHCLCAKAWIDEQLIVESGDNVKTYCWKRIKCELCNTHFKEVTVKNNNKYKLFDIACTNYDLILEMIYPENTKLLFCITLTSKYNQTNFKIGRSRACDIKINQDTVSRNHAEIIFENCNFYLQDKGSTYGTLALLNKPLIFSNSSRNEVCLQTGSTLIDIKYDSK